VRKKTARPRPSNSRERSARVFAVQHAVEVLRCISRAPPDIGINEIARRVRLDKSSVSRLVRTLERERLVERATNSERVRIGFGLVSLAAPLLAGLRVTNLAPPVLEELARQTGETVNLSVWDGSEAVSVQQALGASAIKHYAVPGQRNPAHCTASGKLFLAYLDEAEIEVICRTPLESYSARTITDPSALRTEIKNIRKRGYALNDGEFEEDVGAVAAAVRDGQGRVVGAITATVPLYRFDPARRKRLAEMICTTALGLSEQLGYIPPADNYRSSRKTV
jgi:DNA-binding IclR family transcriptional regulator